MELFLFVMCMCLVAMLEDKEEENRELKEKDPPL